MRARAPLCGLLLAAAVLTGATLRAFGKGGDGDPPAPPPAEPPPIDAFDRPADPAADPSCQGGCAAIPDTIEGLTEERIAELLRIYAKDPAAEETEALQTLLFHGEQVVRFRAAHPDAVALDAAHDRALRRELARVYAHMSVRVIDEDGVVRLEIDDRRWPMGFKRHLLPDRHDRLQPVEVSGTIRRVGVHHLWARL